MKRITKANIIFLSMVLMFFSSLTLSVLNFFRSKYDLGLLEENNPEIYITGLKDIEFRFDKRNKPRVYR